VTRTTLPPRFSVPDLFPQLAGLARETVRLHPRVGTEPEPGATKLGGEIVWPSDLAWPTCTLPHPTIEFRDGRLLGLVKPTGNSFVAVVQLSRRDVPELGFPADADLFQLLWCPNDHEPFFGPVCRAYWHATDTVMRSPASIPQPNVADGTTCHGPACCIPSG
jgi:hypothetical protein